MFTGLVQAKSKVIALQRAAGEYVVEIAKPSEWLELDLGESIAVDGVCLTLTKFSETTMEFFVGLETLKKTRFSDLEVGRSVNLERSLAFGDKLGGHMVTGHVDGTAEVLSIQPTENGLHLKFQVSLEQFRNIIPKGSICVNGVSLTVNTISRDDKTFEVYLIPETLIRTNLSDLKNKDIVNLECDQYVKVIAHQFSLLGDLREYHP